MRVLCTDRSRSCRGRGCRRAGPSAGSAAAGKGEGTGEPKPSAGSARRLRASPMPAESGPDDLQGAHEEAVARAQAEPAELDARGSERQHLRGPQ